MSSDEEGALDHLRNLRHRNIANGCSTPVGGDRVPSGSDSPVELEVICAWCPDAFDPTRQTQADGKVVSHGICEVCRERFEKGE